MATFSTHADVAELLGAIQQEAAAPRQSRLPARVLQRFCRQHQDAAKLPVAVLLSLLGVAVDLRGKGFEVLALQLTTLLLHIARSYEASDPEYVAALKRQVASPHTAQAGMQRPVMSGVSAGRMRRNGP